MPGVSVQSPQTILEEGCSCGLEKDNTLTE